MKVYLLQCYDVNDMTEYVVGVYSTRDKANRIKAIRQKEASDADEWQTFRVDEYEVIE